jgi:hypothetical protein
LLLAANERLHALRRELGISGAWPEARETRAAASAAAASPEPAGVPLPAHLGWVNDRLGEHLRRHAAPLPPEPRAVAGGTTWPAPERARPVPNAEAPTETSRGTVRHYPDLGLAMLRQGRAAAGRVWLLLRHLDAAGKGWVGLEEAARLLATDGSPLRICGRRQFRNLLAAGEGVFWDRAAARAGDERLWLRGPARVAAALGVERLTAAPVALPLSALTGGIGDVRAHLYAAFHSGRSGLETAAARGPSPGRKDAGRRPISRTTLSTLSAASANSQRAYERRARVVARGNLALGPLKSAVDPQAWAWKRGQALFTVVDREGRYGRPGAAYLAWRLPNDYTGPHARLSRGRLKRINRRIAGLLTNGMTGNVNPASDARGRERGGKRYFGDGRSAAAARQAGERYWRAGDGRWHWWPEDGGRRSQAVTCQPPPVMSPRLLATDH